MAFDKCKLLQQQVKKNRHHIKLLKYHKADAFAGGENPGDKGRRVGNSFIAEETYSLSLCKREREKERGTIVWRMHIEGWRIFMNREDSEMREVQKILLVYLVCINLYPHIFCLCWSKSWFYSISLCKLQYASTGMLTRGHELHNVYTLHYRHLGKWGYIAYTV